MRQVRFHSRSHPNIAASAHKPEAPQVAYVADYDQYRSGDVVDVLVLDKNNAKAPLRFVGKVKVLTRDELAALCGGDLPQPGTELEILPPTKARWLYENFVIDTDLLRKPKGAKGGEANA